MGVAERGLGETLYTAIVARVRLRMPRPLQLARELRDRAKLARYKRRGLTVGENFICYGGLRISEPHLVKIGNNVSLSANVTFIAHDAAGWHLARIGAGDLASTAAAIVVHDDSGIGFGAIILQGVSIGPRSIVGAGSVVRTDVPPDTVVLGNPARVATTIPELTRRHLRLRNGRDEIGEFVHGLLARRWPSRFSVDDLIEDATLDSDGLGLDSVEIVEVVLECEERYGVPLDEVLVTAAPLTIRRLVDHLAAGGSRAQS